MKIKIAILIACLLSTSLCFAENDSHNSFNQEKNKIEQERQLKKKTDSFSSIKMNKQMTLEGEVVCVVSDSNIVIKSNNQEIMVRFKDKVCSNFKKGDKVSVVLIPYRVNSNGIIIANGKEISVIDN